MTWMELTHFVFRLIGQQMPQDSRILTVLSRHAVWRSFSLRNSDETERKPVMEKLPEPVQEEYEERHPDPGEARRPAEARDELPKRRSRRNR